MEKALEPDEKGFRKVRHIGISNFNVTQIDDLLANSKVKPFVSYDPRVIVLTNP